MGFPILAQPFERGLRQRYITIFVAFAMAQVNHHVADGAPGAALAVDMPDLELGAFAQAQATGVDGLQTGAIAQEPYSAENRAHFLAAEDHRQFFFGVRPDDVENGPTAFERFLVEKLDAAERDGDTGARPLPWPA